MLEMVGRSLMMQPLKALVGMGSLSQVLFGAFSTTELFDTIRRYRLDVSEERAGIRMLSDATPDRMVRLIQ